MKDILNLFLLVAIFVLYSFSNNHLNLDTKFLIIETLTIQLDDESNITFSNKFGNNNPLHLIFTEYFVENDGNYKRTFPENLGRSIVFRNIYIPKQSTQNLTSEIENFGLEIVRDFTRRNYFKSIDYQVESPNKLKIIIK